jgi:4'-phosphopantetheinyl transferase
MSLALVSSPLQVLSRWQAPESLLAPYEVLKARQLRSPSARVSYLAAHLLVREAAAVVTGLPMRALVLQQRCPDCGGPHGAPSITGLPRLHVSMSHSDHAVAAVVGGAPVAIDVEDYGKTGMAELLQAPVFAEAERIALAGIADARSRELAMLRLWVRKECLIKLGRIDLDALAQCDLQRSGEAFESWRFTGWHDAAGRSLGAVASRDAVELRLLDETKAGTPVHEMRRGANDSAPTARHNCSHTEPRDPIPMTARFASESA